MSRIIINPIGGLANRMRAIACGLQLAQDLNVGYKIVWSKNWELNAEFNDVFRPNPLIEGNIIYPNALKYDILYSMPRKRNGYVSGLTLKRFGLVLRDGQAKMQDLVRKEGGYKDLAELVNLSLQGDRDVYIQSGVEFYEYDCSFYRDLFKPSATVMKRVESIEREMGENRIGLHIRRTDNIESIKKSPDYLFYTKIDEKLSVDPSTKFYLATDDESVKEAFGNRYPGVVFFSAKPSARNTKSGIIDAMVEMTVLSRTKQIFGSFYSSYSEAAAIIGDTNLEQLHT